MGLIGLETYVPGRSQMHRWEPRQKLVSLMALMFALAMVQRVWLVIPMVGVTALLYRLSGLPLSFLRQRWSYPGLFILAVVILLPFTSGETVLGQWGWISVRGEGLTTMVLIVGRFFSILTLGFILFGTTPFLTIVRCLRSLGLPPLMADMALLAYRYLYDIGHTLRTMKQAMQLRGLGQRPTKRRSVAHWAMLLGNLLLRSYEQSQRVYQAMVLRGYGQTTALGGTVTTTVEQLSTGWGLTVAVLAIAVGFVVAEVSL
ncbi:cobalt ECF transporter T component CbiQ [Synechocystis salina LEGE 06099]|uniref:cobalt ECF transporter T component CbiQ n=1 Tax=Synechocystis salina TaxID=945780 RepID=UPI001881F525|nr:cobalt ECF transporter T component CbiQ [Synechocystis salina]MBE9203722.1 cobalt ECF transporter T component CbiQ [Synechocystis salina LEGE 06099]